MESKSTKPLLALLFTGTLMGALDLAIIGPALPALEAEFGLQERQLSGLINSYTLFQMFGALLLAKIADRIGPRFVYVLSVLFFAAGSLLLVVAQTEWMLFAGRSIQGFGAGGIFPAAAAVIGASFAPAERGKALGMLGAIWGLAFLVGPILGGILLRFSWHWLFAINLPIAAVLIVGAFRLLPTDSQREPKPFDRAGIAVLVLALGALILSISKLDTRDALASLATWPVGGGLAALAVLVLIFWLIEKRATDPIVQPALFESAQISKASLISFGISAVQSGSIFIPALLVLALGIKDADAALLLLPGVIAATVGAPLFGRMINKTGTKAILVGCNLLSIISLAIYAFLEINYVTFIIASIIGGIGTSGLVGAPVRYIVLGETGPENRASAQGLLSVVSSVGRLAGAAVVGAVAASLGGGAAGYQGAFVVLLCFAVAMQFITLSLESKEAEQAKHAPAQPTAPGSNSASQSDGEPTPAQQRA